MFLLVHLQLECAGFIPVTSELNLSISRKSSKFGNGKVTLKVGSKNV